jgi:hypothetical protein
MLLLSYRRKDHTHQAELGAELPSSFKSVPVSSSLLHLCRFVSLSLRFMVLL